MSPETLTVEVTRAPSGRWTAKGADTYAEGLSQAEALRALAERIDRRDAALAGLREAVEDLRADARSRGLVMTDEEIEAEIRAHRRGE